jgi:cerevisin
MGSPHVAGLVAYFLSMPAFPEFHLRSSLKGPRQRVFSSRLYTTSHAALPSFVQTLLPLPQLVSGVLENEPVFGRALTPLEMKAAILAIATKGIFSDLPEGTPNLLVYNKATGA